MDNRYKYRLKKNESKSDVNEDSFSQVSFNSERSLLPVGEINHIVDVGEEFNKERNTFFIYRLQGTVCPLFGNPLMNPNGNSTSSSLNKLGNGLDIFEHNLFTKPQIGNDMGYPEAYNKYLIERDGWFGFTEPDITKPGLCDFYYVEPGKDKFDLNSYTSITKPYKNWEITVTYPYDTYSGHTVVGDTALNINGLLIIQALSVIVGGKPMIALATSTRHGLENGNKIKIINSTISPIDGIYTVKRLGLDNGDYIENYFVIDEDPTGLPLSSTVPIAVEGRLQKMVGSEPSIYYLRKFKKLIVNNGDYEMYPLAFSNTIFNDGNYQFVINQDIDLEGLKDNLGRPISELYLTFIKTDSNGTFGPIQSGLDLENLQENKNDVNLSNVRIIHDGTTTPVPTHLPLPLEGNLYNSYNAGYNDEFYGDVVEYNRFTLTETVLSEVLHRFNTKTRENSTNSGTARGPRREGYLYKPHHLYQVREFSSYIEQGDSLTGGIPDYREDLGDGRFLWRDYLDIGFNDAVNPGVEYPFTNGAHYMHQNICFMTTRQDPYNNYGLYYGGDTTGSYTNTNPFDPADPIGDAITDNFTVKSSQNVC
jgi:hypothetical protein